MQTLRSPINYLGGKARLAQRIIAAFPPASAYKVFCEPFAGSCSILFAKPRTNHLEVIGDANKRLINFWMAVRDDAEYLQWKLKTLPYSETVFQMYKESLDNGDPMAMVEEAARWYYVNRCTIMGHIDSSKGMDYTATRSKVRYDVPSAAVSYQNAVSLLSIISTRLSGVQIHPWDFEKVITTYQAEKTMFYIDSPYIGSEGYYTVDNTPAFTLDDHRRLAKLLNETPAQVAISHYEHPLLDELYPASKWRRIVWAAKKELSRLNDRLDTTREVLLCNYAAGDRGLWDVEEE